MAASGGQVHRQLHVGGKLVASPGTVRLQAVFSRLPLNSPGQDHGKKQIAPPDSLAVERFRVPYDQQRPPSATYPRRNQSIAIAA
jgi:hypothetical protein